MCFVIFGWLMFEKKLFLCRVSALKNRLKFMFFKKKKLSKNKGKIYKTPSILALLGIILVTWLGIVSFKTVNSVEFKIFEFTNSWSGELQSSLSTGTKIPFLSSKNEDWSWGNTSDITYILITGRWWWNHDAPDLTDTIILAGINSAKETISLLSIPRDLWVKYPDSSRAWKINRIYETHVPDGRDVAIEKLKAKVTEITGKDIDYYVNLDFEGFIKVVDILWWVEVTLENNFVDYEYPAWPGRYKTFILKKWTWTLDGEVALMYARSRHSSSDFDRSLRQQEIISSLREKVANLWYFKNSKTIIDLYGVFQDYVETDIPVWDMIKIAMDIRWWEDSKTLSFNLNDSCYEWSPSCTRWGFLYVPIREYFGGASVLLPNGAIAVKPAYYSEIQDFSHLIYTSPEIYSDPQKIQIHNASGVPRLAWSLADMITPYGVEIDYENDLKTLRNISSASGAIYYNSIERDNPTLSYLESILDLTILETSIPKYSDSDTKIEIVLTDKNSF